MTVTLANVLDLVTLIGALTALAVIAQGQRKTTVRGAEREGVHLATIAELRRDHGLLVERVACVEREARTTEGSVIELRADMKHVLESLIRIEAKLDKGNL